MKPLLLAGALFAVAVWPEAARADSWCIRDSGGMLSPICAFSSAQECIHAAIVGPSGGVCVREDADAAVETTKKAPHKRRASKTYWGRTSAR
jgi:hypothetical protein